ncbi:hypothetical protein PVT67_09625 [Gallaecimonas kandeliae]|uniref:hypothetical protein n=1 Tax=Gallaecimonas kandeliae TaxID=3029055 RepID=UPI00264850A1|nr:hypothetical protein [Gallaecimonas kandeliae]WKE67531.1 hypothetical protein PVT67_09625 [Gallaecimonas kandeliae]
MKRTLILSLAIAGMTLAPLAANADEYDSGKFHHDRGHDRQDDHHSRHYYRSEHRGWGHGHERRTEHRGWEHGRRYQDNRVIVVDRRYQHRAPQPRYRYYHRDNLARIATFAVLAGVTYAIVDNVYYRQRGDGFVYVPEPPAGRYQVIEGR